MIKLSSTIYLVITLSIVVFSLLGFTGILTGNYGKTTNLQTLNKTIELGTQIKSSYQAFNIDNPTTSLLGTTGLFIVGANVVWKFIQLFLTVPDLIGGVIVDFITIMGLPAEVSGGIFLAIVFGIFVGFICLLTGREP
jgi:hypothetical protein